MEIKITVRYNLTSTVITTIKLKKKKTQKITSVAKDKRNWNPSALLVEV